MEGIDRSSVLDRRVGGGASTVAVGQTDACLLSGIEWQRVGKELGLARRELELVQGIIEGKKLFAIAREMNLALGTVKTYSQRVHHKLGVGDQRQLTLAVMRAYIHLLTGNARLPATEDRAREVLHA